ncbi:MAG: HAD-IA family hydrolase [Gammaproteobacteria bacterium]|nr:HAD-IA family hydrolase [Gammaproteobacteria bacterium]
MVGRLRVARLELKALIFDVDGTLADTERWGHRVAFNAAFAAAGLNWMWDETRYGELLVVAGGKERIDYFLNQIEQPPVIPSERKSFVAQLHAAKTRYFRQLLKTGQIPLRRGVERLLREAREEGLRLAVATTTSGANVTALLDTASTEPLSAWFEVIAAGDQVLDKKPAPDIYCLAMEALGVLPEECVVFEDSQIGLRAAQAAGIEASVITVNEYTKHEDFTGASLVVDHLGDSELPCHPITGETWGHQWVDVALLRQLHRDIPTRSDNPWLSNQEG